jgi:membrane protein implicated in regulation of membrane protease activity
VTATALAAAVLAANPGPAVHLAALGLVVVVGLTVYGVVRWRRRREAAQAEREPNAHDTSSPSRPSETPRS